jgi:hypothetical protein
LNIYIEVLLIAYGYKALVIYIAEDTLS